MPKYKVITFFQGRGEYIIDAKDEEEARENYCDSTEYSEPYHPDHNADEEVQEIIKIK